MCDRVTVIFPVQLPEGIRPQTGQQWDIAWDGTAQGFRHKRQMVEGSWTTRVSIEVHDGAIQDVGLGRETYDLGMELVWFRLDGNPVKFFQGWNMFGSPDVVGLATDLAEVALAAIGLGPETGAVMRIGCGYFTRIDATFNFDLGTASAAESLVKQLGRLASIAHRKSSSFDTSMVFPGRRTALSIYRKGPEMRAHPPPRTVPGMLEYADRIVRFEVVTRSEGLDALGLKMLWKWNSVNTATNLYDLWWSTVSRLRFPVMADIDLSQLPAGAKRLYASWLSGLDVNALASRTTVYRHRLAVLNLGGPDIALPKPDGDVIKFRRVLRPEPAMVPAEFAALLYRPKAA